MRQMVKSRAAMTKVSRTISVEENSSSQAGSVVLPDPVCGSRGAKSEQTNPRGCSLSRDSPVSKGKSSKARGGATPSPGAADGMHLSRDIIKGPLKELSKSELNTGIVHVGLSSRKAASVARPSTSAKARKSILEAQSYDWGDQDREAGSSPPANENILSVQHAVDLAQQAVEAFKTPPSKEFSTKWKQGSSGPSRSESARDGKRYSAKVKSLVKEFAGEIALVFLHNS